MGNPFIFVSGVQSELAEERRAVRDFIRNDALLKRYFDVFLFEDTPASDRRTDELYIEQVDRAEVYLGIFGDAYGSEDSGGVSPTEREFDRATEKSKPRLVFIKGRNDAARHPKMRDLIRKAERQLVRRRFDALPDLTANVYASLVDYLEQRGALPNKPFDAAACQGAKLRDISGEKISWFLGRARAERQFSLEANASPLETLTHLNLLDSKKPSNAAVLLFGSNPQRFIPASEVKCLHFHGTEVRKPIPSYQLFKGSIFDQVDHAVDFVMSKLARSVSARDRGPEASVEYEIPRAALAEAIVNAVAHRDYTSNAGVQVMVFADRVEVSNPGALPSGLTPEKLRHRHPSIPRNPLISDPLYLAHYIEKAGTGTLDMIAHCREAGLPEPEFQQDGDQFVVTLWRDWLSDALMTELELTARQRETVGFVKINQRISNAEYQKKFGVSKATASRDIDGLVRRGLLTKVGRTGRGTYYVLSRKRLTKGSKGS